MEGQAGRSPKIAPPGKQIPARQTPTASPQLYRYRQPTKRTPASQYSPLAAQGGYWRDRRSPWQTVVDYFNPRHLNLGQIWEERRQAWLFNVAYNQYFWYAYCLTGLLILSWFVLWWVWGDKVRALDELAENAWDALRHSEYSKREAKAAIRRYNEHVDKCNRVIEDQRSGAMTTPETANLETLKEQVQTLTNDKQANQFKIQQLDNDVRAKEKLVTEMTQRLNEIESRILNRKTETPATGSPNAGLVERINRLEKENRKLVEENRQLKQRNSVNGSAPAERTTKEA
jgi:F0F1-type ATP synthase membrane subunit b/b'